MKHILPFTLFKMIFYSLFVFCVVGAFCAGPFEFLN